LGQEAKGTLGEQMRNRLIIFDLDGVLVKASWEGIFEAYKALLKEFGKDYRDYFFDLISFRKWWNPDWHVNEERMGITDIERSHDIFYEVSGKYCYFIPQMEAVLRQLSKRKILAIFTNRHREKALELLGEHAKNFSVILGGGDVAKLKPDPEGINKVLALTGIPKENALYMGDFPDDIKAGKAAGLKTAAVVWEFGLTSSIEEFDGIKPDLFIRTFECFQKLNHI